VINDMFMANSLIADKFVDDRFVDDRFVDDRSVDDRFVENRLVDDRFVDDVFCFQHSQTIQCGQPIIHIPLELYFKSFILKALF
jgi:hypothetical protein